MSRPRILAVMGALGLAILGTIGMVAYVSGAEARAASGEILVEVWVVDRRVPAGTTADRIQSFATPELVPQKLVTSETVGDLADIDGLVTEVPLLVGEILSVGRFIDPVTFDRELDRLVDRPAGLQEVTIALEPERAGGGQLVPGDTVGVIISFDPFTVNSDLPVEIDDGILPPGSDTNTTTFQAMHKLLVTNVQLEQVPEVAARNGINDEQDTEIRLVPSGNLLVTMAVDVSAAERIIFGAEFGKIWLTNEPYDTLETPSIIQNRGTIYEDFDSGTVVGVTDPFES